MSRRSGPFLVLFAPLLCLLAHAQTIIHVPADQPSIQAGIDAANNGDTVLVAPGTYYEDIDFKGKAITVTSSGGPATTIIDGKNADATVTFKSGELRSSVISNFTIRNGGYASGTQQVSGGGVYVNNAAPSILNNIITANASHAIQVEFGAALIQGNELSNTAGNGNTFFDGSGIILDFPSGLSTYTHSSIIGNTIENNGNAHGYGGGGIGLWLLEGTFVEGNIIRNNNATGEGGALVSFDADNVSIIGNLIYGNSAQQNAGGVVLHPPSSSVGPFIGIIENNTIFGNTTASATSNLGDVAASQMYLSGNLGQYLLVNNIIVGSSTSMAAVSCSTAYNYLSVTPLVFDHNDIYNPQGPAYGGACPDQTGAYGNISADPAFVNSATGDFHLRTGSPAIDAGNNGAPQLPPIDLDGNPRIQDGSGLGYPVVDLGVYEAKGVVEAPPTILTLTPSSYFPYSGLGPNGNSPFTLTAQVTSALGIPTGPITFEEDLKPIGTVSLDPTGAALLQPSVPAPGLHAFIATYPGQGPYSSAVSVKFYVLFPKATPTIHLTSTPNPSRVGTPVTFSISVSSPDGTIPGPITVTDTSTSTVLATLTPDSSGNASFTTNTLALGTHNIQASFAGNSTDAPASATLVQTVVNGLASTTGLTVSPGSGTPATTFTMTATVAPASPGSTVTPTGTVAFYSGTQPGALGTLLGSSPLVNGGVNGVASFTASGLSAGTDYITAVYSGDSAFNTSTSAQVAVTITAAPTKLIVSPHANPAPALLSSYTFNASLSSGTTPLAGQTVVITLQGQPPVTVTTDASGLASFTTPYTLHVGSYVLTAAYAGNATYAPSTSVPLTEQIFPDRTSVNLIGSATSVPQGSPVTLAATTVDIDSGDYFTSGASSTNGTVNFYDGTTLLASVAPQGSSSIQSVAQYVFSSLAVGVHTLTAAFAPGTPDIAASTSAPVLITVFAQDFTLSASSPSITIQTEHHRSMTLTLTSLGSFAAPVTLACADPLPPEVTCEFPPKPVPLAANATATVPLTIDTDAILGYMSANHQPPSRQFPPGSATGTLARLSLAALLPLGLLGLGRRRLLRGSRLQKLLSIPLLAILATGLTACSGKYPAHTPPGTYIIPITATGASAGSSVAITHTLSLTLVVIP